MSNSIKAVLVDDHADALEVLKFMLKKVAPEIEVVKTFRSPVAAVSEIRDLKPDVIFMDVEMPEMDGFELKHFLKGIDSIVVYVTGHSGKVLDALRAGAFDFLEKPISEKHLLHCVSRLKVEMLENTTQLAKETSKPEVKPVQKILINRHDKVVMLDPAQIIYIEAMGSYSTVFYKNGKTIDCSKPISYFIAQLDPKLFYRVHRSYLINMAEVLEITKKNNVGILMLSEGHNIELAKPQLYKLIAEFNESAEEE